jgi:hypothetical protein
VPTLSATPDPAWVPAAHQCEAVVLDREPQRLAEAFDDSGAPELLVFWPVDSGEAKRRPVRHGPRARHRSRGSDSQEHFIDSQVRQIRAVDIAESGSPPAENAARFVADNSKGFAVAGVDTEK